MQIKIVQMLKTQYRPGARVKLIFMTAIDAPDPGTFGTVTHVDDLGNIHVDWVDGQSLPVIMDQDIVKLLDK